MRGIIYEGRAFLGAILIAVLFLGALLGSLAAVTVIDDEAALQLVVDAPIPVMLSHYVGNSHMEHPPLFDLAHWVWVRLVGNSVEARRLHAALYAAAAMAIAWPLLVRSFGPTVGLYAFALTFLSPLMFLFAHVAYWYIAFLAWSLASLALLVRLLAGDGRRRIVWGFALVSIVMTYISYFSWVLFCLYGAYALLTRAGWRINRRLILVMLLTALTFLPWGEMFLHKVDLYAVNPWDLSAAARQAAFYLFVLMVGDSVPLAPWFLGLTAVTLSGCLVACVIVRRHLPRLWWLYAILFVGALAAGVLRGVFGDAKRAMLLAGLYGALLGGLLGTVLRVHRRLGYWLLLGIVVCRGVAFGNLMVGQDFLAYRWVEPWPAIARSLALELRPNDLVVCYHPSLEFYLRQEGVTMVPRDPLASSTAQALRDAQDGRLWYFSTTMVPAHQAMIDWQAIDQILTSRYRLVREQVWLPDRQASLKRRVYPSAYFPEVRIRLRVYELISGDSTSS